MYKDFFARCKETDEVVWMLKGAIDRIIEKQPKDSIYKITSKQAVDRIRKLMNEADKRIGEIHKSHKF